MAERSWNLDDGFTLVTAEEISYLSGVTSAIQTQINGKLANVVEDTTPQLGGDLVLNGNTFSISGGTGLAGQAVVSDGAGGASWDYAGGTTQGVDETYDIQAADEGATAGNARGENSVDLQTDRNAVTQVASGTGSVIVGGGRNTASGDYSAALGGYALTVSGTHNLIGGDTNTVSGNRNLVGGLNHTVAGGGGLVACGSNTTAAGNAYCVVLGFSSDISGTGDYQSILGGQDHTISGGPHAVIGGGQENTISGGYTSHCAIFSGRQNTINLTHVNSTGGHNVIVGGFSNDMDDASSLGTIYSVLVGGNSNYCGGDYNFLGGGLANTLVENAQYSFLGGGDTNLLRGTASGCVIVGGHDNIVGSAGAAAITASSIVGGQLNEIVALQDYCAILGGYNNDITSGDYATVLGGNGNSVIDSSNYALVSGYLNVASSPHSIVLGYYGRSDHEGLHYGNGTASGVAQGSTHILMKDVTTATLTELAYRGQTPGTNTTLVIPESTTWLVKVYVVARRTDVDGEGAAWEFSYAVRRPAGVSYPSLIGSVSKTVIADDSAGTWDADATIWAVNYRLYIRGKGEAGKTVRFVARVELTQVKG